MVAPFRRRHTPATRPSLHPAPANQPSRPVGHLRNPLGAVRDRYLIPVPHRQRAWAVCHAPPGDGNVRPTPATRAVGFPIPANAIASLLSEKEKASAMGQRGLQPLSEFSMRKSLNIVKAVYAQLLGKRAS